MFCPKCRFEYQEGFTTCSDCRIPLVDILPPETKPQTYSDVAESEEISSTKYYFIAFVWFISGYICSISGDYVFIWGTSNLVEVSSKYLRSGVYLNFSLASIAFIILLMTDFIIIFSIAFLLSRSTGRRKIWFLVFIVSIVAPPLYGTIGGNMEYVIHYQTTPSEAKIVLIRILIETIVAYLIITPLIAWLGVTLGNRYRMRKFNP